jgi:glyceraldehyde 3-phosphate dehydrogenase
MAVRVAINGFGRIGRQIARIMHTEKGAGLELVAVNTLEPTGLCAHLLEHDSLYGSFPARITADPGNLYVDGKAIPFSQIANPRAIPWRALDVDIVIDSSGATNGALQAYLQQGVRRVIATGSAPDADILVCMGANHHLYQPEIHRIICAGSCTTNCIAPAARVIHDRFGIELLTATIVHSYTSGQNLHDAGHADLRRARAAAGNIIPTTTSATEQLGQVLPELAGRVVGVAMRVPTPVVHAADLTVKVRQRATGRELLAAFEEAAANELRGILALNHAPLVSSDLKGNPFSCVVDAEFTGFHDDLIKTILWHDNEHGYSSRVVDLAAHLAARLR